MSIEPSILAQPVPEVTVTQTAPATVTQTTSFAADAQVGGLIGQTENALAKYPLLLIQGVGIVILVLLLAFAYLLVAAVTTNSAIAQHYLASIFTAWGVWVIAAGVIVGGAYALPQQSPFQGK